MKLMFSIRWNQNCISRRYFLFLVFVSNLAMTFQNVDFVFPVVAVERREAASVHCEVTHQEGWRTVLLVDKPLYLHTLSALFSHRSVGYFTQIGPVQWHSLHTKRKWQDKWRGRRWILASICRRRTSGCVAPMISWCAHTLKLSARFARRIFLIVTS